MTQSNKKHVGAVWFYNAVVLRDLSAAIGLIYGRSHPLFVDDDTQLVRNMSVQSGLRAAALRDFSAAISLIYGRNNMSVVDNDI